jgi:hypothetical protein
MQLSFVQEPTEVVAAAIVYDEAMDVDAIFAEAVTQLRRDGVRVAGLSQKFAGEARNGKRSVWLENLASGALIRLDRPRGPGASGCILDPDALARAACVLRQAIALDPDLILVNRFGHAESEGRGLRAEIAEAICAGLPLLIAVRYNLLPAWEEFLGGPAHILLPSSQAVQCWVHDRIETRVFTPAD